LLFYGLFILASGYSFGQNRREYIFENGQIVGVSESCNYTLSANSRNVSYGAATGTFNVTSAAGCSRPATSNQSWLVITAGGSGSGSGAVSYSVAANAGNERTGVITVAGQTFTVYQVGPNTCPQAGDKHNGPARTFNAVLL